MAGPASPAMQNAKTNRTKDYTLYPSHQRGAAEDMPKSGP